MFGTPTLDTGLKHLSTVEEITSLIENSKNVMICCGRMGPMCIPVYEAMEEIQSDYKNVEFRDMLFDAPDAAFIRNLPECKSFSGLPFTVYYKDGKVVAATSSIQNKKQVKAILDTKFAD